MASKRNNPSLVNELIEGLWTMDKDEFEQKYNSLNYSDMDKVGAAIDRMGSEWLESDDDDEAINVYDAADIWLSTGKDEDYMFGYSEEELERAANI